MKDVIDVLAFQDRRVKLRKLIDYRLEDDSFMGVRFLFECGK